MWYLVCTGQKDGYNWKSAHSNPITAHIALLRTWWTHKDVGQVHQKGKPLKDKVFIKKRSAHPDRDYPQHKCEDCGYLMSTKELHSGWDWGGPHCPNCENGGMKMFSEVSEPIISGRAILNFFKKDD